MNKTLQQLCEEIEDLYEHGVSMLDSPLFELVEELSNRTGEIKTLYERIYGDSRGL